MDPFSLAVGISGLVTLTAQTVKLTRKYYHGVKNASKEAAALAGELDTLHSLLSRLEKLLLGEDAKQQSFREDSVLVTSTNACKIRLVTLHNTFENAGKSRMSRAMWPLNDREHHDSMQEIRMVSQWIQFAVQVDGW